MNIESLRINNDEARQKSELTPPIRLKSPQRRPSTLAYTGTEGPPVTRTWFLLPRFLAYVRASWGFCVSRGFTTVPLTQISCNTVFSKS